jgi:D-3-phosphoglycerate dehydrogenase / 2-oxoglutarate reductase
MHLLAISDNYIPAEFMRLGFAALEELDVQVEVRSWEQPTLIDLQQANLAIE